MTARVASSPYMGAPPGKRSLRRDIVCSTSDGTAYCVMLGVGETYLPAFVLALGLGQVFSGLIATLPMLAGALLQLVTPLGVRAMRSYRSWIVLCATLQSLTFLALAAAAVLDAAPPWAIFVAATMYWATGLACGPAWSTWISLMIPPRIRAKYFAQRTRYLQVGVLVGILLAGWVLSSFAGSDYSSKLEPGRLNSSSIGEIGGLRQTMLRGFGVIFALAGIARGVCTVLLACQSEPRPLPHEHAAVSTQELFGRVRRRADGKLLAYAAAMAVATQIAQPFFNPYMRTHLELGEDRCAILLAASFLGRIIALPWLGRVAHRSGGLRVLMLGGLTLVPAAGLWAISGNFWFLIVTQLIVGAAWAAHELGVFLLFLETMPERERTSVLTKYNVLNSFCIATGSVLGGWLIEANGRTAGAYIVLFVVSSAARALALVLISRIRDPVPHPPDLVLEPLSVRPDAGSVDQPILASFKHSDDSAGDPPNR